MWSLKVFLKKSRRGGVTKIVREHYLRNDIACGSKLCEECCYDDEQLVLDPDPLEDISKAYPFPHYLILDTNVILHQIDVLEENVIRNVIILQTVLEEVRHNSTVIHRRLRNIINNKGRKFYVFINEHHKDTYIEKNLNETTNDRNDRAVRIATKWYESHLLNQIRIILITDDVDCREKATKDGILASSMEDYVRCLKDAVELVDKLAYENTVEGSKNCKDLFPCHLSVTETHNLLKSKKVLQGSFQASRENFLEGHVLVENYEKPILIQGRSNLNRVVDGDIVAIELLDESEWSEPSQLILEDEEADDEGEDEDKSLNSNVLKTAAGTNKTPTGKVVGIIRRKWRQYCGILLENPDKNSSRHLFIPADRKIPKIRIETRQISQLKSQRIVVAIDSWPRHSKYPLGHFVRALGEIDDETAEKEVILLEHDVPHYAPSEKVLKCLPELPWIISEEEERKRENLRHLDICSVDPPGCTDIDDALHCKLLDNGNYEVGVHIADVTHFVRPNTAIDEEAALRGTTVYLVETRIDMLPDLLSSNLCSLRENVDRFAFSCIWELNGNAEIVSVRFSKSIIKSKASLTYEQAQFLIDDPSNQSKLAESLRNLNQLAKKLKQKRMNNGALVLASAEVRFNIDTETQEPLDVECKQVRDTNSMVEEFMLLANMSVAEKIYTEFPDCALLRCHPEPPQTNFESLITAAKHLGFEIDPNSGKQLAISLNAAVKKDNPYFNTMLRMLTTRCMTQAVYFCTGMSTKENFFHYGLAVPMYTHFTSPIRRYADVMVHRFLASCIDSDTTYANLVDKKKVHELCYNLNYRHRMAQYAARASVALYTHIFFRDKIEDEQGYVLYVRKNALQILIPKYGLEGTLYLSNRTSKSDSNEFPKFIYNEEAQSQMCDDVTFYAFDPVTVQISLNRDNVQHQKLVLKLVKPFIPNFSVPSVKKLPKNSSDESKNDLQTIINQVVSKNEGSCKNTKNNTLDDEDTSEIKNDTREDATTKKRRKKTQQKSNKK